MKVVCVNNNLMEGELTRGKVYELEIDKVAWNILGDTSLVVVLNDDRIEELYAKSRFVPVEVWQQFLEEQSKPEVAYNENTVPIVEKKEMVNHPSHYNQGNIEVIDVIEDWNLNFNLGSAVKYIGRAGYKDDIIQDLEKALWYVTREIERLKKR